MPLCRRFCSMKPLEILYEDNHLLIVNKPAQLATMGVAEDKPSVLSLAREYIKQKYDKPGNVYLGVVSRLDAPVTGVLVIARTSKAASRLSEQFRKRDVDKVYRAIVEGVPDEPEAKLQHWLRKDERHRRVHVTMKDKDTAQEARLRYRLIRELPGDLSLLEVRSRNGTQASDSRSAFGDRSSHRRRSKVQEQCCVLRRNRPALLLRQADRILSNASPSKLPRPNRQAGERCCVRDRSGSFKWHTRMAVSDTNVTVDTRFS